MALNKRRIILMVLLEMFGVGAFALLLYYLSVPGITSAADVWATERVLAYVLLVLGPLLLFLPVSLYLQLGPLWVLGTGSWALLGYVLVFVGAPRREEADFFTYVAFLALLFVALGSAMSVPLGALSKRLLPSTRTREMARAMREGMLLSLFIVTLLAMSPLGVLNWLNVLLVFTIVSLTEFFFLARG